MKARVINIREHSSISSPYGLFSGEVDEVRRGPKEIKSQTRTILKTITHCIILNTIRISE